MKYFWYIYDLIMDFFSKTSWRGLRTLLTGKSYGLTESDWDEIKKVLDTGYFIILTEDRSHLSSWMVKAAHFALTRKWSSYSHALVNVESDNDFKYKFVEAIGTGVRQCGFSQVFKCDSICILKPKYYTNEQVEKTMGKAMQFIGKKYDKRFRYNDEDQMSCVEIARSSLKDLPDYEKEMRVFEYMISSTKNLTPPMFRQCPDFEVVLEIKA